jgi:hypothetical protein
MTKISRLLNRFLTWPIVLIVLLTGAALAQTIPPPPSPDTDAAGWIKLLYGAVTSKAWGVVVGLVLIGLVYPLRRFGPNVLKTPFGGLVLAFSISLAATLGAALAVGVAPSLSLAASALATAATAAGVWEWLKAHIPGVQAAAVKSGSEPKAPAGAA